MFLIVFILALCLPFESFYSYPLFEAYDALGSTPEGIKPEWYFYFVYYPLEILPFWVVMLGMTVAGAGIFLSRGFLKTPAAKVLSIIAWIMAAYLIVITFFGQFIYESFQGVPLDEIIRPYSFGNVYTGNAGFRALLSFNVIQRKYRGVRSTARCATGIPTGRKD